MKLLLLESDRRTVALLKKAATQRGFDVMVASAASEAVTLADEQQPDVVVCELTLKGHSGSEFLYEFRSYPEWQDIPVIVYTSLALSEQIKASLDWKLFSIADYCYKPDVTLAALLDKVVERAARSVEKK